MRYYLIWTAVFIVLCLIEASTLNLITIWFAAGSLITLICAVLGVPPELHLWIFVVSSLILLALTRPIVKKKLRTKDEKMNADRVIGKKAIVKEAITPDKFAGAVSVGGKVWSAISKDGSVIEEGEEVTVEAIDGVKLVVANKIKAEV